MTKPTHLEPRSYPGIAPLSDLDKEMFGPVDPLVQTNKRVTRALLGLTSLVLVMAVGMVGLVYYFESRPVQVLSINDAGKVQRLMLQLSNFTLHNQETQAALRSSLTAWADGFYSRLRNPMNGEIATVAYPKSFLFLDDATSQAYSFREQRDHEIAAFMSSGDPEYKASVTNVNFRNLEQKPYEADLYFDRISYSQPLLVTGKKSYLVTIHFSANPSDEEIERLRKRGNVDIDTVMKVNPLVVAITQIGEERSFSTAQ